MQEQGAKAKEKGWTTGVSWSWELLALTKAF